MYSELTHLLGNQLMEAGIGWFAMLCSTSLPGSSRVVVSFQVDSDWEEAESHSVVPVIVYLLACVTVTDLSICEKVLIYTHSLCLCACTYNRYAIHITLETLVKHFQTYLTF